MHGHELLRTGRTEEALQEFLKTKELEDSYYRVEKFLPNTTGTTSICSPCLINLSAR
jgi:hypothetical protein